MFTWVGSKFDAILGTYVLGVVSSLMSAITPIALSAMTLWVLIYGWAVLRNEVSETVPTFLWKVTKIGLVLAFALNSGVYIANVADTATALATGVATTFLPSSAPAGTIASPYALLDQFNDNASKQVSDIMKEAGITRLDLFLAAGVFSIGTVAFLCVAVFIVTLAKVFLTFVIGDRSDLRPVPGVEANATLLRQLAVDAAERGRVDLVRVLRPGTERLHRRSDVHGDPGQRRIRRPDLQCARREPALLRRDDRHGDHLLPGAEPCLGADRRRGRPAGHPNGPKRHDGRRAASGTLALFRGRNCSRREQRRRRDPRRQRHPHAAGVATSRATVAGARFAGTMATGAGAIARGAYTQARAAAYRLAALRGRA